MEEGDNLEPLFLINKKNTGRLTHNYLCGDHSFYRRTVKPTGYATFSCKYKDCQAKITCRYTSKEASNTEEEPTIIRYALPQEHVTKSGLVHLPSRADFLINATRNKIRSTIEENPLMFVFQVYESIVTETLNEIKATGNIQCQEEYIRSMPTALSLERTMYRWRVKTIHPSIYRLMLVLKSEIEYSLIKSAQAEEGLISIVHRQRAKSVMNIRQNLRSKLLNGHITLFRYMRSMGSLSSKIDSHAKFVIRLAEEAIRVDAAAVEADTVNAVVADAVNSSTIEPDAVQPGRVHPVDVLQRFVLTSVSEIPVVRGRGRGHGQGSGHGNVLTGGVTVARGRGRGRGTGRGARKNCQLCSKDYASTYIKKHTQICKGPALPPAQADDLFQPPTPVVQEPLGELILEDGSMFNFDMNDAILPNDILLDANITLSEIESDREVTMTQIENDVFYMDPTPGTSSGFTTHGPPRQHNRYGSGDLSGQLVDDFGRPIYRVVTRSMSRSSQASDSDF